MSNRYNVRFVLGPGNKDYEAEVVSSSLESAIRLIESLKIIPLRDNSHLFLANVITFTIEEM